MIEANNCIWPHVYGSHSTFAHLATPCAPYVPMCIPQIENMDLRLGYDPYVLMLYFFSLKTYFGYFSHCTSHLMSTWVPAALFQQFESLGSDQRETGAHAHTCKT